MEFAEVEKVRKGDRFVFLEMGHVWYDSCFEDGF